MSEAASRFASLLKLSDKMLTRAERQDLEERIRLLAVYCAGGRKLTSDEMRRVRGVFVNVVRALK